MPGQDWLGLKLELGVGIRVDLGSGEHGGRECNGALRWGPRGDGRRAEGRGPRAEGRGARGEGRGARSEEAGVKGERCTHCIQSDGE